MEVKSFPTREAYLSAQERTERSRSKRPFYVAGELEAVAEYVLGVTRECCGISHYPRPGYDALCHGARYGHEVERLRELLPGSNVIGTDLFPKNDLCVQHDFRIPKPEWMGKFDFLFSNSLDHSDDPETTLRVWFHQLRPDGLLFLEWCKNHMTTASGDCFGANLHEYIELIETVGELKEILYIGTKYRVCVLVGKRKNTP